MKKREGPEVGDEELEAGGVLSCSWFREGPQETGPSISTTVKGFRMALRLGDHLFWVQRQVGHRDIFFGVHTLERKYLKHDEDGMTGTSPSWKQ